MTTYPDLKLYIGGAWRKTAEELPVLNPADESIIGAVPLAAQSDLDDALTAAAEGFRVWSRIAPRVRAEIMLKAAALMRERVEEIAYAITLASPTSTCRNRRAPPASPNVSQTS